MLVDFSLSRWKCSQVFVLFIFDKWDINYFIIRCYHLTLKYHKAYYFWRRRASLVTITFNISELRRKIEGIVVIGIAITSRQLIDNKMFQFLFYCYDRILLTRTKSFRSRNESLPILFSKWTGLYLYLKYLKRCDLYWYHGTFLLNGFVAFSPIWTNENNNFPHRIMISRLIHAEF